MNTTMNKLLLILALGLGLSETKATVFDLGDIDLTGSFTVSHEFNFNHPESAPFGTFGIMTVAGSSGIFGPTIDAGDILQMNSPVMSTRKSPLDWDVASPMTWSIGGFLIETQHLMFGGPSYQLRVTGLTEMSFLGFMVPTGLPGEGLYSDWHFIAPPIDLDRPSVDITAPISLQVSMRYNDGRKVEIPETVPDTGSTLGMLGMALIFLVAGHRKINEPHI